jgi:MoaA/NifB/PqqE/SkfB family radical SAM enzyme
MPNKLIRWIRTLNYPSYVIFFVTARCNAGCKMCFYRENMLESPKTGELTPDEYDKITRYIKLINILGISGGEPFLRQDLSEIIKIIYRNCSPMVVDLPTNGYFTESVLRQAEDIAGYCKNMVVDLQLSIDGPEAIHNEIRGLKDGFSRVKETYMALLRLKPRYKNLRVKACVVYSHYNQEYIEELFAILGRDFKGLDRVVFSVVHGSVSDPEASEFDWDKYFAVCRKIEQSAIVKNISDLHSIFTIALRLSKNDLLKKVLETKDMYKRCRAGKRVIVINETGEVMPCEQLWESVGNLRKNGYDIARILNSPRMQVFSKKIMSQKCNCHWGLPLSNALLYMPEYYPKILADMAGIFVRSILRQKK